MDEKIKQALEEFKKKPIQDFYGVMADGLKLGAFTMVVSSREINDESLAMLCDLFDILSQAAHYEQELRQAAIDTAGGADVKGDTNKATEV